MAPSLSVRPLTTALPPADIVIVFSNGKAFPLPERAARVVRDHLRRSDFTAAAHQTHRVPLPGSKTQTVFVVGTGEAPTLDVFRRGVAAAVHFAKGEGLKSIAVRISDGTFFPLGHELGRVFAEAAVLANYRFTAYSAEAARRERSFALAGIDLCVPKDQRTGCTTGVRRGVVDAQATLYARDLVNEPASRLTPAALVENARRIARGSRGGVQLRVLNRKQCAERGMGAFLAVARGSAAEPFFLHLAYRPSKYPSPPRLRGKRGAGGSGQQDFPRVVLIGKGITFDSGGLSIKPAEGMERMKIDMAGAAVVLGVFSVLPKLRFPLEVHGMIAACENMPSGTAVKPGDIVRTSSGKTVEVLNTDAEGRLTLADALVEALTLKPHAVIDLATLTGACVVALGEDIGGLFSNDESVARRMLSAAAAAGEPVWRLPLFRDYRSRLKSTLADLKNITGNRHGGAISAALFLQEFVGDTPWAHLDIAGPSYAEKPENPVHPVGATGFGVRTLLRYLEGLSEGNREEERESSRGDPG